MIRLLLSTLVMVASCLAPERVQAGVPPSPERATSGLQISLAEKAIVAVAGNMGRFELGYPTLLAGGILRPTEVRKAGDKTTLRYANGGTIVVSVKGGAIVLAFADLPARVTAFELAMHTSQ